MLYYHGSDQKFDEFDISKAGTGLGSSAKVIHLTPHKEYAIDCIKRLGRGNKGYLYTVQVIGQEETKLSITAQNICFGSNKGLVILEREEVLI